MGEEIGVPNAARATALAVRGSAFNVHRAIGPGYRESICRQFLAHDLRRRHHMVQEEVWLAVEYDGLRLDRAMRADMIVDGNCLVELKSVEQLHPVHYAQTIAYLKATGLPVGLLINFNVARIEKGCQWMVHPDLLRRRTA